MKMKWIPKLSISYTILGGLWSIVIVWFALMESGCETQLCRYIIPLLVGSVTAFIIGKTREMDKGEYSLDHKQNVSVNQQEMGQRTGSEQ